MKTTLTCEILHLSSDGRGVAKPYGASGPVVFVSGALPGELVQAEIEKQKKRYAEARSIHLLRPAHNAVQPVCPHWEKCGGCPLQTMPYEAQLEAKSMIFTQALRRVGGIQDCEPLPIIASPFQQGFRNKMTFAFGQGHNGELVLGQRHRAGHSVEAVPHCALLPAPLPALISDFADHAAQTGLPAYTPPRQRTRHGTARGFWRFVTLRTGWTGNGCPSLERLLQGHEPEHWRAWLLVLTSAGTARERQLVRHMAEQFLAAHPDVAGIVHEECDRHDTFAVGTRRCFALAQSENCSAEQCFLPLAGKLFCLDVASFFQVNTAAAQLLAQQAQQALLPLQDGQQTALLDLYCGAGAPALVCLAPQTPCWGVENDSRAISLARRNASSFGLNKTHYRAGDAAEHIQAMLQQAGTCSLVLVDPPRAGLDARVLQHLLHARARRIVYISCNPATFARDAARLQQAYRLQQVQPIDLFPHTPHLESLSIWEEKQ